MKSALSQQQRLRSSSHPGTSPAPSTPAQPHELSILAPLSGNTLEQEVGRLKQFRPNKNQPAFTFHHFDQRHLILNSEYQELFSANSFLSFESIMNYSGGGMVKNKVPHRITTRIKLKSSTGDSRIFYLKRHTPAPHQEYFKAWSRLRPSFLGAQHEWNAILNFHSHRINTMTPVAFGKKGRYSFLITESLEQFLPFSDWIKTGPSEGELYSAVKSMARFTRQMHAAGLHHQDYYLNHLMLPKDQNFQNIHLIDLGRAQQREPLTEYWVIKDLAQWNYSARSLSPDLRKLFFEFYFGMIAKPVLSRLLCRIQKKTEAISRHSTRHSLG